MKSKWYTYLWIWSALYFALGMFHILFAWLGTRSVEKWGNGNEN